MKKKILGTILAMFVACIVPTVALAADFGSGDSYTLRSSDIVKNNLYAAGGNVQIEGVVYGDLITAGGTVVVSGNIEEDVMVVGGNVIISGNVEGDVRVAGGSVTISGEIDGELLAAGGEVLITSDAEITQDVLVAGGRIVMEGNAKNNFTAYADEVILDGVVTRIAGVEAQKIDVREHASIEMLAYKSPEEANVETGAVVRSTNFEQTPADKLFGGKNSPEKMIMKVLVIMWFVGLAVMILTALVINKFMHKEAEKLLQATTKNFWPDTLRGFLATILLPIGCVLLLITVIGAGLGIFGFMIFGILGFFAKLGSAVLIGGYLMKWITKSKEIEVNWKTIIIGMLAAFLLILIPVIGWIVGVILYSAVFGTLCNMVYQKYFAKK